MKEVPLRKEKSKVKQLDSKSRCNDSKTNTHSLQNQGVFLVLRNLQLSSPSYASSCGTLCLKDTEAQDSNCLWQNFGSCKLIQPP